MFSSVACFLVMVTFLAPFLLAPSMHQVIELASRTELVHGFEVSLSTGPWFWVLVFLYYLINYGVIVFFNAALVSCAMIRFKGDDPTIRDGLRMAWERLPQIVGWSAIAATVGALIQLIESRSEWVARIVARVLGLMWTVGTYFIVPVLVVERIGPVSALRRSVELLRKAWGEGLAGNVSMGLIHGLIMIPLFLILIPCCVLAVMQQAWIVLACVVGAGAFITVMLSIVMSTLRQIFLAGLYICAAETRVPEGFTQEIMESAFRTKRA